MWSLKNKDLALEHASEPVFLGLKGWGGLSGGLSEMLLYRRGFLDYALDFFRCAQKSNAPLEMTGLRGGEGTLFLASKTVRKTNVRGVFGVVKRAIPAWPKAGLSS
jgi:hypothetical protein